MMTQSGTEMLAVCGLDCASCAIRQIPLNTEAAQGVIAWFRQMGWLQETEGVAEAVERKMYCNGCQGDRSVHWSDNCALLLCCIDERHRQHCGQCAELMRCDKLEAFAGDGDERHKQAVDRLRQRFGP